MENYPKKEDKYWVLERKIVFLILFFKYCVVLTWKIVVPPKASVLYIYIDNKFLAEDNNIIIIINI